MAKIMLVEDDTNLSEIYEARLRAEGYDIVATKDGEEALATAVKEHPDLIICDVMMPKISGFEMLDILRGTEGIKNTKVIMMTALSQAEDKARASSLGADRYLVKSQVTLEDVVKVAKNVLDEQKAASTPAAGATPAAQPATAGPASQNPMPAAPKPTTNSPLPPASAAPQTTVATTPIAPVPADIAKTMTEPGPDSAAATLPVNPTPTPEPPVPAAPVPAPQPIPTPPTPTTPPAPVEPVVPPEAAKPVVVDARTNDAESSVKSAESQTSKQEQQIMGQQINDFVGHPPIPPAESLETEPASRPTVAAMPPATSPAPPTPVTTAPAPTATPAPAPAEPAATTLPVTPFPTPTPEPPVPAPQPIPTPPTPTTPPAPVEPVVPPEAVETPANDGVTIPGKKVIQPLNDVTQKPDLDALLRKEQLAEEQRALANPSGAVISDQTSVSSGYLQPTPETGDQAAVGADPNSIAL